ncbi:MAG: bifunctional DNA primase/polymerase, partial [Xanthobacteraceae bacterium]
MRQFALQFARAGVPIVPLKVSFENGRWRKRPHIKDWAARATTNEATIETWWRSWPQAHIGVPLEPLNLVVIDADRHPGGPDGVAALSAIALPPHQAVVTMSDGEHHFFRQPAPRIRFAAFEGIQVLGDG